LDFNFKASFGDLIIENNLTVSENKRMTTELSKMEGKSLINNRNKRGPKCDP